VPSFLRAVLATGYTGTISLEIFNEKTPLSPRETASAGLNSLVLMENWHGLKETAPGLFNC
jgi:4-hydroxyphenylpyruvate dioxygenase